MKLLLFSFLFLCSALQAQQIPFERLSDWSGAKDNLSQFSGFEDLFLTSDILADDGITPNDEMLKEVLDNLSSAGTNLYFPAGKFLFNRSITLPSNVRLIGAGADSTVFLLDLGGSGDGMVISGSQMKNINANIISNMRRNQDFIVTDNSDLFEKNNWIRIIQNDSTLVTSTWAINSVGQIVQVAEVIEDTIFLRSRLRLDIEVDDTPSVYLMDMKENVGIECLSIVRMDDTSPQQSSNIVFENAVNCKVSGIESAYCSFAHIGISTSVKINVQGSYFHEGFDYGGGGRAYGVVMQFTSGECLIENNIFRKLRHSILLQAGANGNVVSYNYSHDPFWTSVPSDAAGDIVLHGNYVFANLFEQNICQNIVIDNSHGPNGPFNTFFRNRAEKFGIFFSADNSPGQNIAGNEITNTVFPYSLVNYTIRGDDQFVYGNNNKGSISPESTYQLDEKTLNYVLIPSFLRPDQFAGIGTPNQPGINTIPAFERWTSGFPLANVCGSETSSSKIAEKSGSLKCFPNPFHNNLILDIPGDFNNNCVIYDAMGRVVFTRSNIPSSLSINTSAWNNGFYFVSIHTDRTIHKTLKVIKI